MTSRHRLDSAAREERAAGNQQAEQGGSHAEHPAHHNELYLQRLHVGVEPGDNIIPCMLKTSLLSSLVSSGFDPSFCSFLSRA